MTRTLIIRITCSRRIVLRNTANAYLKKYGYLSERSRSRDSSGEVRATVEGQYTALVHVSWSDIIGICYGREAGSEAEYGYFL